MQDFGFFTGGRHYDNVMVIDQDFLSLYSRVYAKRRKKVLHTEVLHAKSLRYPGMLATLASMGLDGAQSLSTKLL